MGRLINSRPPKNLTVPPREIRKSADGVLAVRGTGQYGVHIHSDARGQVQQQQDQRRPEDVRQVSHRCYGGVVCVCV